MMKKWLGILLAAICVVMMISSVYAEKDMLPAMLTRIEAESFFNCDHIRGLIRIPALVEYIGPRAFDGTRITAVELGKGLKEIAPDAFGNTELCYVYVHGKDTKLPQKIADAVKYVFAAADADAAGVDCEEFVDAADIAACEGFYYEITDEGARLLCAVDGTQVPSQVKIPAAVAGKEVVKIAADAFWGCDALNMALVPDTAQVEPGVSVPLFTYSPAPLDTPQFERLYSDADSVWLTWKPDEAADRYTIYRSKQQDETPEKVGEIVCAEYEATHDETDLYRWEDAGLELGSTWYYALQAHTADGTGDSDLSEVRAVTVSSTILKKPTVSNCTVGNTSCTLFVDREEGDGIFRTDIYLSYETDMEFFLAAQLEGTANEYCVDYLPEGAVAHFRIQTFAVVDGVEWVSEMSDIIEVELESAYREKEYGLQYVVYAEGPVLQWYAKHGDSHLVYHADCIDGPYEVIGEYHFNTAETGDTLTKYQIPLEAAEKGGYFKVQQYGYTEDYWQVYAKRSEALYVPSLEACRIIIRPDRELYETGAEATFMITLPEHIQLDTTYSTAYFEIESDFDGSKYSSYICETRVKYPKYPESYHLEETFSVVLTVDGQYTFRHLPFASLTYSSADDNILIYPFSAKPTKGSPHPYHLSDRTNGGVIEAWYEGEAGSGYQLVTFSTLTDVSDDRMTLYDEWGQEVCHFTGTECAGKTVVVRGSRVGVRLEGTNFGTNFGYAIVDMVSMPYVDLQGVSLACDHREATTEDAVVWTARVKNGCVPFTVQWTIFKDGQQIDELTTPELSLSYYPTTPGEYYAAARISDHRCNVQLTSDRCTVTQSYSGEADFTYTQSEDGITLTGYLGNKKMVSIPERIGSLPVVAIGDSAFARTAVQAWVLPDSISRIGTSAFEGAKLTEIRLPDNDSLTLGKSCFRGTGNLRRITLTKGIPSIPDFCFAESGLQAIHIPANISTLGERAFEYCRKLSELTFAPMSVRSIWLCCFFGCTALRYVKLPDSLVTLGREAFSRGYYKWTSSAIWISATTTDIQGDPDYFITPFPGENCIIYAPEDSYAARWVQYNAARNGFTYGGGGCDVFFGGAHDYQVISDTISLDEGIGLHQHSIVYECTRCKTQMNAEQAQNVMSCWRCEAKAENGSTADIPVDGFEFMDRFKLADKIYYRIQLTTAYKGVAAGANCLFVDEKLQMVTDADTLKVLFRTTLYTGQGSLPWEYTAATSNYPTLEHRQEQVESVLTSAYNSLQVASSFLEQDECYKKLGSIATEGLKLLWGNPSGALITFQETVVPDMDSLLVAAQLTLFKNISSSVSYDIQHYNNSLYTIINSDGYIICEKAEASLECYANALAMAKLSRDNSQPIIDEIVSCGNAFGVGVRNILTMLESSVDEAHAKAGFLMIDMLRDSVMGNVDGLAVAGYIEDLAEIAATPYKSSSLGLWQKIYKGDLEALKQVVYLDSALEKYDETYNAFCMHGTQLIDTHIRLAGE